MIVGFKKLLIEGGVGGHIPHPFDIADNGQEFLELFNEAVHFIKQGESSVKIDGVNASVRLVNNEFVLDRGSSKTLDVKGIRPEDLEARFGVGHGFIEKGKKILQIFDEAFPSIQKELKKFGLLDHSNILLNVEYVEGQTNVIKYSGIRNFLAIHGLMSIRPKRVEPRTQQVKSRETYNLPFDKKTMQSLISKVGKVAKKYGFDVLGNVEVEFKKTPNFSSVLNEKLTFNNETKTLKQWVLGIQRIDRPLITRKEMLALADGSKEGLSDKQVNDFVLYYATIKLGIEILKNADSPIGALEDQEGIVITRKDGSLFKITGTFLIKGMESAFQS